jgi:hypothetical protein
MGRVDVTALPRTKVIALLDELAERGSRVTVSWNVPDTITAEEPADTVRRLQLVRDRLGGNHAA